MSQPPAPGTPTGSAPVDPPRRSRPAWLIPLVAAVVVLLLLLLLLSQCAGGDDTDADDTEGTGAGAAATSSAAPSPTDPEASATPEVTIEGTRTPTASPSTPTSTPTVGAGGAGTSTTGADDSAGDAAADATLVTAGGTSVLALVADASGAGLASVEGQDVQAEGVQVESVPADEGFWVGTGDQRVWVELDGEGESAFEIESEEQLDFSGQVVANDDAFLQRVSLTAAEGADQLQQQGYHLLVDRDTVEAVG